MPIHGELFARFEPDIRRLPPDRRLEDQDLLEDTFLLDRDRDRELSIYYAPMDWLRPDARVAIVGITPGKDTMRIAYQTVVDGLAAGRALPKVLDDVKVAASFSGFRTQLLAWLTWLGVPEHIDLLPGDAFWRQGRHMIHPTSAIRYPVFVGGRNYSGRSPDLVKHPVLLRYVHDLLVPELSEIPNALIVPLGDKVSDALTLLASEGFLDLDRCLVGFPHPSGNNGHRMRQWSENREALKRKVVAWFAADPVDASSVGAD